jgi:hypothetical protein
MVHTSARRRIPDTKVMFGVTYADGRTAYLRVQKEDALHNLVVTRLAQEQQACGAIPPGTIAAVKRVR